MQSDLVSIHSDIENTFIFNAAKRIYRLNFGGFWIGLQGDYNNQNFQWVDRSPFQYAYFLTPPSSYRCISMYITYWIASWSAFDCAEQKKFICKRDFSKEKIPVTTKMPVLSGDCEVGWYRYEDRCFKIIEQQSNFDQARKVCQNNSFGNLAFIDSQRQQNFLAAIAGFSNSPSFWIGLRRNFREFIRIDRQKATYTNWAPDVFPFIGSPCVEVLNSVLHAGQWQATNCYQKKSFICQKPIHALGGKPISEFPTACPLNAVYNAYRGSCYNFVQDLLSWTDAEDSCQKNGAHLVSISDANEYAFVTHEMTKRNMDDFWIGLNAVKDDSTVYEWSDKSKVYYSNWGINEPNIDVNKTSQCVFQKNDGNWYSTGICEDRKPSVCEIQINKSPTRINKPAYCPKDVPKDLNDTRIYRAYSWSDIDKSSDYCYFLSDRKESWPEASLKCHQHGGDLVSINSEHELRSIASLLKKTTGDVWIGLFSTRSRKYTWSNGAPLNYLAWESSYPVDDPNSACVLLNAKSLRWRNERCGLMNWYICSIKKVSDPNLVTPPSSKENEQKTISSGVSVGVFIGTIVALIAAFIIASFVVYRTMMRQNNISERNHSFENVLYKGENNAHEDER
ncbi:macrophage mannose receptor 1-like isoform X2 [Dinothrombium tinctorium]|uniref:Macrophage mannose receptor 1-like isoform X2 n=1 Tax=Dinothrombium tinctorium TaxID=1965070 RepID=A0A3S3P6X3_9ACAR|nr:macrophage mannose receptor 1-like isoform X2 [Dinothrombium tinctorium]RWS02371.1 macrophage mannose receptor 1-like isoform X2 [Dinothrombium tinctorium]